MRHRGTRSWWRPWRIRCAACGCPWFPCPDSITQSTPAWARQKTTLLPRISNRPTARDTTPLMTPGALWRSRRAAQR